MKPLPPRFSFALSFSLFCLASSSAAAQIVPDASLPVNSSVVPVKQQKETNEQD